MTKTVTYLDLEESASTVQVHGVSFEAGKATKVEDDVADKLSGNRFFKVKGEKQEEVTPVAGPVLTNVDDGDDLSDVKQRGADAKKAGKPRNVPPAYRGKASEAAWLAGYDGDVSGA